MFSGGNTNIANRVCKIQCFCEVLTSTFNIVHVGFKDFRDFVCVFMRFYARIMGVITSRHLFSTVDWARRLHFELICYSSHVTQLLIVRIILLTGQKSDTRHKIGLCWLADEDLLW